MKRFFICILPFVVFGLVYNSMRYFPNYLFNSIDIVGVYNLEKQLFGFISDGILVTPNEFFKAHHIAFLDILSGIFYLCWVPLPIIYCIWLYFTKHQTLAFRLACGFLFVNLVGFCGYYIHPAAPPWYIMQYGFEPIFNTPGNVAGFEHFDSLIAIPIFHSIYAGNANVFAAIPSLHAAYCPIALYYATKVKDNHIWISILAVVSIGIWFSAVYSCHHYVIDVLLGILTVIIGLTVFEYIYRHLPRRWLARFFTF